jgi:hypothetical protein
MNTLPLPIRLAAGLAALAIERARKLPQDVSEWPMTAVSQALQISMRVQQRITELAIKGDEALASLREPEDDPPWAVFDEDMPRPTYLRPEADTGAEIETEIETEIEAEIGAEVPGPGGKAAFEDELDGYDLGAQDTTTAEERSWFDAIDEVYARPEASSEPEPATADQPIALPSYPGLSLASVRGRLRVLTVTDLEELLGYELGHGNRPEFVQMLTNRIATVRGTR